MATNRWKCHCAYSDSDFLLAHSQYRLRMSSFPCIRNGRQKSGFIIARSFQGLWFHEVDCDNQEWFHVRVAESDVVEEEQLHPPRRSGDEHDDDNTSLRRFVLDLPHCLASHGLRGTILFLNYRVIQSYLCSSLCPFPHIQIASCLLTREEKGSHDGSKRRLGGFGVFPPLRSSPAGAEAGGRYCVHFGRTEGKAVGEAKCGGCGASQEVGHQIAESSVPRYTTPIQWECHGETGCILHSIEGGDCEFRDWGCAPM